MNFDLNKTETQILFQSLRSLITVVGLAGIVVVFIESGTGQFFETIDRLANATDLLNGIIG